MNKRQKIIWSVTGLILVLLILIGLTYAYFLTKIQGNTNTKSISVSTANLAIIYGDGNANIITKQKIMPGEVVGEKDFTVTNEGNSTSSYMVVLDDIVIKDLSNNSDTTLNSNDFVYTLSCVQKNKNTGLISGTCNGVSSETELPLMYNEEIVTNSIAENMRHEYVLTVTYKETGIDQSADMNKLVEAKLQIYDVNDTVNLSGVVSNPNAGEYVVVHSTPKKSFLRDGKYRVLGLEPGTHTITVHNSDGTEKYSNNITITKGETESISGSSITVTEATSEVVANVANGSVTASLNPYDSTTLAYAIINNAKNESNGTVYRSTPLTMPGRVPSLSGSTSSTVLNDYSNATYFGSNWVAYSQDDYKVAENAIRKYRRYVNPDNGDDDTTADNSMINQFLTNNCNNMIGKMVAIVETSYSEPYVYPEYLVTGCSNGKPVVTNVEKELSITRDDLGTSFYYRGNVTDNYLNFGGMCWRIVRIEGDGSIKLILEDKDTTCDSGSYTGNFTTGTGRYGITNSITNPTYSNSGRSMATFETGDMKSSMTTWLNNSSIDQSKLKTESWCFGDRTNMYFEAINSGYNYGYAYGDLITNHTHSEIWDAAIAKNIKIMYQKLMNLSNDFEAPAPSLTCTGETVNSIIGAINVDELDYAGGKVWKENNYYILNDYQKNNSKNFWAVSLAGYQKSSEKTFYVKPNGSVTSRAITENKYIYRPSIVLKNNITLSSGNGTKANPYVIN